MLLEQITLCFIFIEHSVHKVFKNNVFALNMTELIPQYIISLLSSTDGKLAATQRSKNRIKTTYARLQRGGL